jgi:hypothetical protein
VTCFGVGSCGRVRRRRRPSCDLLRCGIDADFCFRIAWKFVRIISEKPVKVTQEWNAKSTRHDRFVSGLQSWASRIKALNCGFHALKRGVVVFHALNHFDPSPDLGRTQTPQGLNHAFGRRNHFFFGARKKTHLFSPALNLGTRRSFYCCVFTILRPPMGRVSPSEGDHVFKCHGRPPSLQCSENAKMRNKIEKGSSQDYHS